MATDRTVGDVQHNLHPIMGWLSLALADGTSLSEGQMRSALEKLALAIEAVKNDEV